MILTEAQTASLASAALAAVQLEEKYQLPALVTVAQWAIESGWGAHQPGNNCFGIKQYSGCYGCQTLGTTEYVNGVEVYEPQIFATFPELSACFEYRAKLLTSPESAYYKAWQTYLVSHDAAQYVRDIAPHYATDPHYPKLVIEIMRMPAVIQAVQSARQPNPQS